MNRLLRLAAALLSFCALTPHATAGGAPPPLLISNLDCPLGNCETEPAPGGGYLVGKFFTPQVHVITLTGLASVPIGFNSFAEPIVPGQFPSAPIDETIFNTTGLPITAYLIELASNGVPTNGPNIAGFINGGALQLASPTLQNSPGACSLMDANLSIACSGLNVPQGGAFGVRFLLTAVGPVINQPFALTQGPTTAVPEPGLLALLGLGLAGLAATRRRTPN